MLKAEYIFI